MDPLSDRISPLTGLNEDFIRPVRVITICKDAGSDDEGALLMLAFKNTINGRRRFQPGIL